jgi:glycosyltransferase involved in cell wall biosynthesis
VEAPIAMNVLLSAYACKPDSGSEPGNGWNWALHLAQRGMRVTVLTRREGQAAIEAYLLRNPTPNLTFAWVTVPAGLLRTGTGLHYFLWQFFAVKVARALQRERKFDVAHHVTYTSIHVPTQLWRLGIPTVFGPVGGGQTAPAKMLSYFGAARPQERARTLLTAALSWSPLHRRWLSRMSAIFAANADTLAIMHRLGRQDATLQFDIGVTSDEIAPEPRTFAPAARPLRVIWVGRMLPRKALPLALDAFAQVRHPATLTIAGSGIPEETVREMIRMRGLTERIAWEGRRLTVAEMDAAYREHDVLLFTSLRETLGVQILEAMARGLPVITLDLHGASDVVSSATGIKVPVTTPSGVARDLAAAIDSFAAMSAEQKNTLSRNAWEFARSYTWASRAARTEAVYREVLGLPEIGPACSSTDKALVC